MDDLVKVSPLRDAIRRRKYGQSDDGVANVLSTVEIDAVDGWVLASRIDRILDQQSGQPILPPAGAMPLML